MANARHHLLIVYVFIFVLTKSSYSLTTTTPLSTQKDVVTCGKDAVANKAPFIVALELDGRPVCAGSILSENWIVIAAHCLRSKDEVMNSTLVAGSTFVGGDASSTQRRSINYYIVHDLYSARHIHHDIALVYTATPFTWSSAVAAINLPDKDTPTPSVNAISYGWDRTNSENHPTLQVVTVPIISQDECQEAVDLISNRLKVDGTHICTTFTNTTGGGVGICNTDCRGPLVQKTNNQNVLIGVSSAGANKCNLIGSPSLYVLVSSQLSWINDHQVLPSSSDLFNV